jgi:hypothetical protein
MPNTSKYDFQRENLSMKLRSSVPGRERWDVPCVRDHPAWATTVEAIIGTEEGVELVFANPTTGRVLVEFNPSRISAPVKVLLERSLAFRPMTAAEAVCGQRRQKKAAILAATVTTELVCSLFKFAVIGVCPCTAALILPSAFLLHRAVSAESRRLAKNQPSEPVLVSQ